MVYQSKKSRDRPLYIAAIAGILPVSYLGVLIAPYVDDGLIGLLQHYSEIQLFNPVWVEDTPKTVIICLMIYGLAVAAGLTSRRRYHRHGVEQGSSDWADAKQLQKEFKSQSAERIVYTQNFAISFARKDLYRHKRNLNALIVGGPGAGKTTGYVYPNLLEMSSSYVVLDPSGEVCRNTAKVLQEKGGYTVKVLNLKDPEYSWCYNPFAYIKTDDDVQQIVTAIYKATTVPGSQSQDPFWDEAGKMLLSALMYLLVYFGADNEKNFPYVMELLRAGRIEDSEDDTRQSALDILFESIEQLYPDHICVRYYKNATSGAGKTLQSVQITLLSRLQKFELESIKGIMCRDELALEKLADSPTVLYLIIPDDDTSYNFIASLLYIQLFQVLYQQADTVHHGRLPRFVHIVMDEFANVHTPDDFLNILATCRKRNIGISIILQNFSQLKAKYKEGWENVLGQCDEFMYLGGNESSTHEYVSKMLGKETIDTQSFGRRYGLHGDSSANVQIAGRELMTPDEVRLLSYDNAIVIVKNAPPLVDRKIDIFHYKKAACAPMGGAPDMEYIIPKRSDRLQTGEKAAKTAEAEQKKPVRDPYADTVTGELPVHDGLTVSVDGVTYNVADYDVAELVQLYEIDVDEIEQYVKEIITQLRKG